MRNPELTSINTMKLLLREALCDRRIDDDDKQKIRDLAEKLGLDREIIEEQFKESMAKQEVSTEPPREFDSRALFSSACELALADGVLTENEKKHLFALKEVLQIQDDWYRSQMQHLAERCNDCAEELDDEKLDPRELENFEPGPLIATIVKNIEQIIIGKTDVVKQIVTAALANSHILLEDVPGTGKTMLARALAASIDCTFKRVQFTPDLLPMDVTGSMIYNPGSSTFSFKRGPVFTNIFLADEINRATPRTQSSLLEVMEERQVSVDGAAFSIPKVFFVLATQNPIDQHGTYPLPEAQLDRFLLKLSLGYPDKNHERKILAGHMDGNPISTLKSVISRKEFRKIQHFIREKVMIGPEILDYILDIVEKLRQHENLLLGPSPRASIALMGAARAWACVSGRGYVIPDDVKKLAEPVFAHRLILQPKAMVKRISPASIVNEVLDQAPVPVQRQSENKN